MRKQNSSPENRYMDEPQEEYPGQNIYVDAAALLQNVGLPVPEEDDSLKESGQESNPAGSGPDEDYAEEAYPEELYPRARTYNMDEGEMRKYTDDPRMLALSDEEFINEFQGMGAGAMWTEGGPREVDLSKSTEAEKIAYRIIHDGDDPDDYRALCEMANMLEEYEEAEEGEELDRVIMQAAAVLGVNIIAL